MHVYIDRFRFLNGAYTSIIHFLFLPPLQLIMIEMSNASETADSYTEKERLVEMLFDDIIFCHVIHLLF